MPDQSSAASEHAIMQEITQPLVDLPDDPVATVANAEFPLVLRGYHREAVDDYVRSTAQLVAELYARRSPEGAVRRALERVGEQVSSILARAHETAESVTSQSRAEADERLMQARAEAEELERDAHALADQLQRESEQNARERERAAELRVQELERATETRVQELERAAETRVHELERAGETRVQELDAEVDRIWAERDRMVSDVRKLAEELSELAGVAAKRFPATTDEEAAETRGPDATDASREPGTEGPPEAEPDFSAGPEGERTPESEVNWREVPADFSDDQFMPVEHEAVAEQPTVVLRPARMRVIDLDHLGTERVIGCWQVDDILIDPGPESCLEALLAQLEERPRALLLTHIHLDHAGAAGSLVKRWPDLEVYVHEQGADHLADPARLLESARRLYGDDMDRLWGEFLPVPEANLRVLRGGEQLFNGRFEVAYTPGHASHHVSYLYERTAFVGDVGGVRITPETLTIPPTPPPDIDIEAWHASIDQVLRWKPERLAMTHFGSNDDIGGQLADLADRLDTWAALVHTEDLKKFVGVVESEIQRGSSAANRRAYKQAAPPEQIYAGLERYWRKREGGPVRARAIAKGAAPGDDFTEGFRSSAAEASTHAGRFARLGRWVPPVN